MFMEGGEKEMGWRGVVDGGGGAKHCLICMFVGGGEKGSGWRGEGVG